MVELEYLCNFDQRGTLRLCMLINKGDKIMLAKHLLVYVGMSSK